MTRLNNRFNWGQQLGKDNPVLYRQLNDVYSNIAENSNGKTNKTQMTSDPSASADINANFDIGDIWVRTDTNTAWIMTSRTSSTAVTWTQIT